MTKRNDWLQFFAEGASGGDGGEGAGTGVISADAGRDTGVQAADAGQRLEALGVPRDRAEKFARRMAAKKTPPAATEQGEKATEEPPETSAENKPEGEDDFDLETALKHPKMQKYLQGVMAQRGKAATQAKQANEKQTQALGSMLNLMGQFYGLKANEDGSYDAQAVANAVMDDDRYYEKYASDMGVDVDVGKRMARMERESAAREAAEQKAAREAQLREHFMGLQQQASVLRETFPDFDLNRELQDPRFFQRTSPKGGMSVEDAFYSLHHQEILEKQAEAMAKKIKLDVANSIRAGQQRPRENGGSGVAAVKSTPNLKDMDPKTRKAYIIAKFGRRE